MLRSRAVEPRMKLSLLLAFLLIFVLCDIDAKRYSSGSSHRSSSGSRWGGFSSKPKPSVSKPSSPVLTSSHNGGKTSSTNFLLSESGRPSRPAPISFSSPPVRSSSPPHSAPYPTGSHGSRIHTPSAPPSGNSKVVHENHQQSSSSLSHSDPYGKQPASNPYVPSGGYGHGSSHIPAAPNGVSVPTVHGGHPNPPYPLNHPNHPQPNPSLTSSSYPSISHHPSSPVSGPIQSHSYPNVNSHPPSFSPNYGPSYHPSNPYPHQNAYHPQPAYQPATTAFVPGRTVYVVPQTGSSSKSSGPGLGTYIASGVAGGVAAGATNAIVDHAISSIFRSSPNHVHTYPSAPAAGTPTSSVTNNYYYGQSGTADNPAGNINNNPPNGANGQAGPVNGPAQNQPYGQPNYAGQPSDAQPNGAQPYGAQGATVVQTNPGGNPLSDGKGNPSSATNGAVVRTPEGQPEAPAPSDVISDEDLMKFTEELFEKQDKNLNQYVEMNLQKRATNVEPGKTVPDEASEPLFTLKPELDSIPTVSALRALYDNYQRDGSQSEVLTPERRNEENAFLEEVVKTPVMSRALDWLVQKKYVESDDYEKTDVLRRMWFRNFDNTSSGFERIFLSEKFGDSGVVGMQNWLYFAHLESQKKVNYLGYADTTSLSGKGSLLKLNYETEGFTIQNATIFVGTAPELELSLYTVCFYARPNNWCPISLGGAKFFILTHYFRYFGKDLIDLGFPAF